MNTFPRAIDGIVLGAKPCTSFTRTMLTAHQAHEIYQMKPEPFKSSTFPSGQSPSRVLAELYGMSPKAIRDIWNKRTWIHATLHPSILSKDFTSNEVFGLCSGHIAMLTSTMHRRKLTFARKAVQRDPRTNVRAFATIMSLSDHLG